MFLKNLKSIARRSKSVLLSGTNDPRFLSITVPARIDPRGRILFCHAFPSTLFPKNPRPLDTGHTCAWESLCMIEVLAELGFTVDVISHQNRDFHPKHRYVAIIGVPNSIDIYADRTNPDAKKILFANYAHWLTNNLNQYRRLDDLRRRRNVCLRPLKLVGPNDALSKADAVICLGNEFTMSSFAFGGKPVFRVPITSNAVFDTIPRRDYASCRRNFIWFGSRGLVHKGLDLTLEVFSSLPDHNLTVIGGVRDEPEFRKAFHKELYGLPNIRTIGWADPQTPDFLDTVTNNGAAVFPSCSEGGGGSLITCMHAGLIPIASYESSVDISTDYGICLTRCSLEALTHAVLTVSSLDEARLQEMGESARDFARSRHMRSNFADGFRSVIVQVLGCG